MFDPVLNIEDRFSFFLNNPKFSDRQALTNSVDCRPRLERSSLISV